MWQKFFNVSKKNVFPLKPPRTRFQAWKISRKTFSHSVYHISENNTSHKQRSSDVLKKTNKQILQKLKELKLFTLTHEMQWEKFELKNDQTASESDPPVTECLCPLQARVFSPFDHHCGPQHFYFCWRPVSAHRHLRHSQSCRQHHHHPQRLRGRGRQEVLRCLVSSYPDSELWNWKNKPEIFLHSSLILSCSSGTSQRTNVISCVTVHDSHDSDSSTSSPLSPKNSSQPAKSLAIVMPSVKSQPGESTTHKAPAAPGALGHWHNPQVFIYINFTIIN